MPYPAASGARTHHQQSARQQVIARSNPAARTQPLTLSRARPVPDHIDGLRLAGSEAGGRISVRRAQQGGGAELASACVPNDPVLHSIQCIARRDRGLDGELLLATVHGRPVVLHEHWHLGPRHPEVHVVPVDGGRASENALVIVGEPLRHRLPLAPARAASVPVAVRRWCAEKELNQLLADDSHHVLRTPPEVDDELCVRYTQRAHAKAPIHHAATVASVGCRPGVSQGHSRRWLTVRANVPAAADRHEAAVVSAILRQPDPDVDRRCNERLHEAVLDLLSR